MKNSDKQDRSLLSGKKLTLHLFSKKAGWRTQEATGQSALLQSLKNYGACFLEIHFEAHEGQESN